MLKKIVEKVVLMSSIGLTGLACMSLANADNDRRIINLQAEAVREVANDEMQAVLYTELNEKDASVLANKINTVINQAIDTAKQYPKVHIKTGNQNTYPVYNDKRQLVNWRGRAEVVLNSQDFKQTSELVAKLQNRLQLQGISFDVSDAQRQKVEDELYIEASRAFQQRAQLLVTPWNASKYELVNLQLNTSGGYRPMPMYAKAAVSLQSADIESQNIEAGNSEIKVVANGSIQLQ
ncbi:SIMPL domain-containing protein [Acinetobacter puyangensis]|uniref:Predicted secreted protein n=1 Tax=Acinetobacter puyangensis TaxID=1096779 RepID=A0A240EDQ6_9GAMM|nr:SIMPL domain-containing protein [Acinetobacter puyangensis]SNX46393.1 Predicted secreted protein [Acinetobacter puyangensis]